MTKACSAFRILAVTVALLIAVGLAAPASRAASCPGAGAVTNAAAAFMNAARVGSPGAFSSALARHADVRSAALFALGQYRKDLPRGRQGQYVSDTQAFMARFLQRYSRPFKSTRDLQIESCRGNLIETSLEGRSRMVWRVGGGRIKDVQVSGVWLSLQLRSKFTGIIRRNNGNVEALLDYLDGRSDD